MWIYVAGITGLGVVAATGGLAAAAAVSVGTLALLSISGGFTAGTFAVIDNADLAKSYTIAAKRVDTALTEADGMVPSGSRFGNPEACGDALLKLKESVTDARAILEASRTDVAVGALDRAREAQKTMTALLAAQPGPVTQVTRSAEISAIPPIVPRCWSAPASSASPRGQACSSSTPEGCAPSQDGAPGASMATPRRRSRE